MSAKLNARRARACVSIVFAAGLACAQANEINIVGPGDIGFGQFVTALPNGNIVVQNPNGGPASQAGAVYLYSASGTLISTLTGSSEGDEIGVDPVIVLPSGNFLVVSYFWNNGGASQAGAVTWVSATDGLNGEVSAENSLIGTSAIDQVGQFVYVLANGNYVVASPNWDNGATADAGAVTWGDGYSGVKGVVSASNSLVGSTQFDWVGAYVVPLTNGNYTVVSSHWSNGAFAAAGAVTWGDGGAGVAGTVSAANSLVGSSANDGVGSYMDIPTVTALKNGNYVVLSPSWNNGSEATEAGAATWGDGTHGTFGAVTVSNSLVGSRLADRIGLPGRGTVELSNGNYVVISPSWSSDTTAHVGAVTWGDGAHATSGIVSPSNSLVGSSSNDFLAADVTALTNGNYAVGCPEWTRGAIVAAGAVTWVDGSAPFSGVVSVSNSLTGSADSDGVGNAVVALANGNYVISSPYWHDDGGARVGAATWGDGTHPMSGEISSANSLVGSRDQDRISSGQSGPGVVPLTNGNYIVLSPYWSNGTQERAGAASWGDGATGVTGVVSAGNSLVGTLADDFVGEFGYALPDGHAVISSSNWTNNGATGAGAVTWIDGASGVSGSLSITNSLVGTSMNDQIGYITLLKDGNYVVASTEWSNGSAYEAGAAAWGNGRAGIVGAVSAENAVVGDQNLERLGTSVSPFTGGNYLIDSANAVTLGRGTMPVTGTINDENSVMATAEHHGHRTSTYDPVHDRVIVGWFEMNMVTIFQTERLLTNGFD